MFVLNPAYSGREPTGKRADRCLRTCQIRGEDWGLMTETKPVVRARQKEDFRARVIETARRLFLEKGVSRTSMADLGRTLGVSKPTVYEAFRSKDLLMDAVFNSVAGDVDLAWLERAVEVPRPFPVFLDEVADGHKRVLATPRSVDAFSLLIREGGQLAGLTDAFVTKYAIPASEASRRVVSAAIKAGECAPLDVAVVQKMLDAPLVHVLVDRTLFGPKGLSPALANSYIDHSFNALKTLLCQRGGSA